jgi:two-component system sensor histidine kinase/response regulator
MFLFNDATKSISGYLILNENQQIEEFSEQVSLILRKDQLDLEQDISQLTDSLKNKTQSFFRENVIPAITSRTIHHFLLNRKKSQLSLSVTPLNAGKTILSFSEMAQPEKHIEKTLPEKLNEILIRINNDLQITYLSHNYKKAFSLDSSVGLLKTIDESGLFGDKSVNVSEMVSSTFRNYKRESVEIIITKNGNTNWWKLSTVFEASFSENEQSVLLILRNINKQKTIEAKLIESEKRYEMAMEAADLGVWDYDVASRKAYYSRKWKAILGYYPDEIPNSSHVWKDLLHPEDKDRMTLLIDNFFKSDLRIYEADFRMKHKNGHYIWIKSRATALRDETGQVIRMLGTHRDITEEKKSENEYKKLYQAIMQSPISVVITDKNGYIEFFNPAFCKITGWKDEEIPGKKASILKSGFQSAGFYEKLWKTISSGNEWQGEFKNRKKNGDLYWELASISPIKNIFGNITHYVKIAENISYLKKIEKDLKKAKLEAELANNHKNNFIANMSHEIRTPINSIIGFSELIKNEDLSQQKRNKYSEIIEENSQSLLRLIDDIIDISKIEANELKLRKEACALGELFTELELIYNNFLKRKEKPSLNLVFRLPQQAHHDIIFTDPHRLKQILNNLFTNALRHTERGQIEVGYKIVNENKIQFYVSDTGKGIPASEIKNIFKRFTQTENTIKYDHSGVGLGLSISKDLALLLGGDIAVQSIEGEGSVFILTIPYDKIKIPIIKPAAPKASSPLASYNFKDYTIMIAEDTPYNYEYLYNILHKAGANIIWAKDGIDVLKLYQTSKIDLILMDIQLPEINGFDATQQIRKHNQELPIIAQTAYAMAEDRQKCIDSGCNEVLVKPIRMDDVLSTVAKYLNNSASTNL